MAEWNSPDPRRPSEADGGALLVEFESRRTCTGAAESMLGRGTPAESKLRPVPGRGVMAGKERGGFEKSDDVGDAGPRELRPW